MKLLEEFVKSKADYGEIDEMGVDTVKVYDFIQEHILRKDLPISALKVKNKILLSKNIINFGQIYELIKSFCELTINDKMVEIWQDKENNLLNVVYPSIQRHFPIKYDSEIDKLDKIEAVLQENSLLYYKREWSAGN